MRIAHVTTVHRWDDGRIFERQARSLARAGHEVVVLAPGTERFRVDGVEVIPLGVARRRSDRMWRLVGKAGRAVQEWDPDVVVVHDPELLRLVVGRSFRRYRPILVYDAHEDYAAQLREKEWLPRPTRGLLAVLLGSVELCAVRRSDHVFAATPAIARRFDPDRITVVLNRPEVGTLPVWDRPAALHANVGDCVPIVVYVGDLRVIRGARTLIDAISRLGDRSARLRLAGRITPSSLEQELRSSPGWARVEPQGWMSHNDVFRLLTEADVAVLPFLPAANHVESQPNKLFEYLVMGVPVVMSNFPTWIGLSRSVGARFEVFRPDDADDLAAAIRRVLDDPGLDERGDRCIRARASLGWERYERDYVRTVERLVENSDRE